MNTIDVIMSGFESIGDFIKELNGSFKTASNISTPLKMYTKGYNKLQEKLKSEDMQDSDINSINLFTHSFKSFCEKNKNILKDDNSFKSFILNEQNESKIRFGNSDKLYVDLLFFVKLSDAATITNIRKHLICIGFSLLTITVENDSTMVASIQQEPQTNTNESDNGVANLMQTIFSQMSDVGLDINPDESPDPMSIMMKMMQNGGMNKMMSIVKNTIEDENLMKNVKLLDLINMGDSLMKNTNK